MCSHSVAISKKESCLSLDIRNVKKSLGKNRSRSAISYPTLAKGAGKKGEQKRRERAYSHNGTNESSDQSSFTEIWHNNYPLLICSVSQVRLSKNQCGYCGKEFPRGPLAIAILGKNPSSSFNYYKRMTNDLKIPSRSKKS